MGKYFRISDTSIKLGTTTGPPASNKHKGNLKKYEKQILRYQLYRFLSNILEEEMTQTHGLVVVAV